MIQWITSPFVIFAHACTQGRSSVHASHTRGVLCCLFHGATYSMCSNRQGACVLWHVWVFVCEPGEHRLLADTTPLIERCYQVTSNNKGSVLSRFVAISRAGYKSVCGREAVTLLSTYIQPSRPQRHRNNRIFPSTPQVRHRRLPMDDDMFSRRLVWEKS